MKVTFNPQPPKVTAPTRDTVTTLKLKSTGKYVLVFLCPHYHADIYLFVGDGSTTYLIPANWEAHVEQYYKYVGNSPIDSMEVSFNA